MFAALSLQNVRRSGSALDLECKIRSMMLSCTFMIDTPEVCLRLVCLGGPEHSTFVQDPALQRIAWRLIADVMSLIRLEIDMSRVKRVELVSDPQPLAGGVI